MSEILIQPQKHIKIEFQISNIYYFQLQVQLSNFQYGVGIKIKLEVKRSFASCILGRIGTRLNPEPKSKTNQVIMILFVDIV